MPGLLARAGAGPSELRESAGLVYWSRHFRTRDGRTPSGLGAALTHHASLSVLTLPGDDGTFSVAVATRADDAELRSLRHAPVWDRVAALTAAAPWIDRGVPTSDVVPIAGIEDVTRRYVVDGRPVVTGLVAVGDSAVATNPSLGRGASLGALQAVVLRDVLAGATADAAGRSRPPGPTACSRGSTPRPGSTGTGWPRWEPRHAASGTGPTTSAGRCPAPSAVARLPTLSWPAPRRGSGDFSRSPRTCSADPGVGRRLEPWLTDQGPSGPSRADLVAAASPTWARA